MQESIIIKDSNEVYHGNKKYYSSTQIKPALKSPLHYKDSLGQFKKTEALIFGNLCHTIFLEKELLEQEYVSWKEGDRPDKSHTMQANKNKAWIEGLQIMANLEGKTLVRQDDIVKCLEMSETCQKNQWISWMIWDKCGKNEVSFYYHEMQVMNRVTNELVNVCIKIRPDRIIKKLMIDLKTTKSAEYSSFGKDIDSLDYDLSAALYMDVYEAITGVKDMHFAWLAVEKEEPYHHNVIHMSDDHRISGRKKYMTALETIVACKHLDTWPSYAGFGEIQGVMSNRNKWKKDPTGLNIETVIVLKGE